MSEMLSRARSVFSLNRLFIPFELKWKSLRLLFFFHDIKCGRAQWETGNTGKKDGCKCKECAGALCLTESNCNAT